MPGKKKSRTTKSKPPKSRPSNSAERFNIRDGEREVKVFNSGLEVWLYDDSLRDSIKKSGGMDFQKTEPGKTFTNLCKNGMVVGYSLYQDDSVWVSVIVGKPLTAKELSSARWLEPQSAFLTLPSGVCCIESNDASRIGPDEPMEKGAKVEVKPGNYKLTLYRIDYEALDREGIKWKGPQEVVVLTPGGTKKDAAADILPYEMNRDKSWVGQYKIKNDAADVLIWFGDYLDSFVLNIDTAAAKKLKLSPGKYFRTTIPELDLSFISVYGSNWEEARRFPPPEGLPTNEYGYGSLIPMADWDGAEGLLCRRERAKAAVELQSQKTWMPAMVEVLDASPVKPVILQESISQSTSRSYLKSDLMDQGYWDHLDPGFLALILSDVLGCDDAEDLLLNDAVRKCDDAMKAVGLLAQGDFTHEAPGAFAEHEITCRVYTGRSDLFGVIRASEAGFEFFFATERTDGKWVVTGIVDELRTQAVRTRGSIELRSADEEAIKIFKAHLESIEKGIKAAQAPTNLSSAIESYDKLLNAVVGGIANA